MSYKDMETFQGDSVIAACGKRRPVGRCLLPQVSSVNCFPNPYGSVE